MFHFSPNKYFTNSELVKTFHIPNMLDGSEPVLENVEACVYMHGGGITCWFTTHSVSFTRTARQ